LAARSEKILMGLWIGREKSKHGFYCHISSKVYHCVNDRRIHNFVKPSELKLCRVKQENLNLKCVQVDETAEGRAFSKADLRGSTKRS